MPDGHAAPPCLVRVAWDYHRARKRSVLAHQQVLLARSELRVAAEEYARRLRAERPDGLPHFVDFEGATWATLPDPDGKGVLAMLRRPGGGP